MVTKLIAVIISRNMYVLSHFSHVQPFATLWMVACQASLSMRFSKQEYWSELPLPSPVELPNSGIKLGLLHCRSDQISCSVVSDSLRPHESQHARPPCPSQTPGVHSDSCPSSWWCHPAISSSVVPFSSCPQSLPASESSNESTLRMRWPKYGVSVLASFLQPRDYHIKWSKLERERQIWYVTT